MFASSYFPKAYFPGSYFPPIPITSAACELAREAMLSHGWVYVDARRYLVQRAGDLASGWPRRTVLAQRRASYSTVIAAIECLDQTYGNT